jgi:predicted enzyme related to lactoylglutathione lyase
MNRITDLGAAFLNVNGDYQELLVWYNKTLGLAVTEYGIIINSSQQTLISLKRTGNNAYINFTVDDIENYMIDLKKKNVEIVKEISNYDYGKFSQIRGPFGNIIELFEINTGNYEKMVLKELESYKLSHK